MPRSWRYAPWRRYVMQAVMWVILGATVALAALVTKASRRASQVRLGDPTEFGEIKVRVPLKWRTRTRAEGNPRILVQASEPENSPRGRVLTIFRDLADAPLSPLQYLTRNFMVTPKPKEDVAAVWRPAPLRVGGWPGVLVSSVPPPAALNSAPPRVQYLACTVLPSLHVIVVKLDGAGPEDSSDLEAMRAICQDMLIGSEPSLGPANEPLELSGGIKLLTPDRFVPVAANDPNRVDRRLWFNATRDSDAAAWSVIDLVPCLFDARDSKREEIISAISMILAARDPAWRTARIIEEQPGRWRAQLDTPGDKQFHTRAYLLEGPSAQALLCVFHGASDEQVFEPIWQQTCNTTKFAETNDVEEMLSTGAAEVERLRAIGLDKLAGDARENEWLLWCDQSNDPHLGWTHIEWGLRGWDCRRELRLRRSERRLIHVTDNWQCNNDFTEYRADVSRMEGAMGPQNRPDSIQERIQLSNGQINCSISRGRTVLQQAAPSQYVPGGLLPLLIGKLSNKPMIIRTEAFTGYEGLATPSLLTLIIRPANDVPRNAEGESKPMRCVSVQVNGSGELSRWYFRENGDLECVDFSAGVQRLRSDSASIQFTFREDTLMTP